MTHHHQMPIALGIILCCALIVCLGLALYVLVDMYRFSHGPLNSPQRRSSIDKLHDHHLRRTPLSRDELLMILSQCESVAPSIARDMALNALLSYIDDPGILAAYEHTEAAVA